MNVQDVGFTKTNARFPAMTALLGVVVVLIAILALGRFGLAGASAPSYSVAINVSSTHLTISAVEAIATGRLKQMGLMYSAGVSPTILSMTAVPGGDVRSVEPAAGQPGPGTAEANDTVWVVRARGTFVGQRVAPGAEPIVGTTGYLLIDDASAELVGMGMP